MVTICENIKRARIESGKTQQEMADLIKVGRSTYGKYEMSIIPDVLTLVEIGKALNIDWTSLVKDTIVGKSLDPNLSDTDLLDIHAKEILKLSEKIRKQNAKSHKKTG